VIRGLSRWIGRLRQFLVSKNTSTGLGDTEMARLESGKGQRQQGQKRAGPKNQPQAESKARLGGLSTMKDSVIRTNKQQVKENFVGDLYRGAQSLNKKSQHWAGNPDSQLKDNAGETVGRFGAAAVRGVAGGLKRAAGAVGGAVKGAAQGVADVAKGASKRSTQLKSMSDPKSQYYAGNPDSDIKSLNPQNPAQEKGARLAQTVRGGLQGGLKGARDAYRGSTSST
jgi:hypothetical protein